MAALWALAVAQPAFEVINDAPEFFVVRRLSPVEVVAFGLLVAAAGPALIAALLHVVGLRKPRAADALYLGTLGTLAALGCLRLLNVLDRRVDVDMLGGFAALAVAVAAGYVFVLAYGHWESARSFVLALSPAALVFLALFLADSPLTRDDLPAAASVGAPVPVVWVVFDEFPTVSLLDEERRVDAEMYPAFAQLSEDGTWYRNAVTVHDFTTFAVPAMLTGEDPPETASPGVGDYARSAFSLLRDDYRMVAAEPYTALCPPDECQEVTSGEGAGLGGALVDAALLEAELVAPDPLRKHVPERPDRLPEPEDMFDDFTAALSAEPAAAFYFAHVFLPHQPWDRLPSGRRADCPDEAPAAQPDDLPTQALSDALAAQSQRRHLAQVQFTDRLLGRLLDRLRNLGLYDDALVIVAADHGVSFRPGDQPRLVTPTNVGEIAPVPLFIKRPGQSRGRIDDRPATILDVLPTLADVLRVAVPWELDGRSLLSNGRPRSTTIRVGSRERPTVQVSGRELESQRQASLVRKLEAERQGGREGLGDSDCVL